MLGHQRRLLWLSGGSRSGRFFEFLGGLVIYRSDEVQQTTCLKSLHFLCAYPSKVFSAWTEVWSIPWPSTASTMSPGGRDLGDFRVSGRADDIKFLPNAANYLLEIISFPLYIPTQSILRLDRGFDCCLAINGVYYGSRRSRSGEFSSFWAG